MGVIVKLTNKLIRIAKAITRPKLLKKRPTCPPMKTMGRKITKRDQVVAVTAIAISEVA
jgi:hypothetical protein